MEDGEWVLVKRPTIKDLWRQSSVEDDQNPNPLKLTFTEPAKHWTDAIPIGNGRLGAMVWGGVASETLQLNEDTLWTGNPGNYTNPKAPEALAEVRKLVDSGQYVEATKEAVKLSADPSDVYQLLGDIKLEFDDSHLNYTKETYSRELDLDTATVKVKYSVGDVEFTREHFASTRDQVIVTKISGSKPGLLSFTVYLESKLHHHSETSGKNQIRMGGSCPGKRAPQKVGVNDNPKGIQFSAVLDVLVSDSRGVIQVLDDKKLKVDGSDWAVLLLVAHSSFDGPFTKPSDSKKDPTSDSLSGLSSIRTLTYSDLYARHLDDYQSLFHRVSLQLSKSSKGISRNRIMEKKKLSSSIIDSDFRESDGVSVSTAERVKTSQADEDPSLVELLFQYGRYLLISCSRPGTQISNLQGIWNKDLELAWDGAPHLNVNLQMNYWPSLPCNLKECQEPLFDYMSSLSINGNKTAKVNYEASGWVVHQVSDIWAKTSPDRGEAVWALWPMGGAWLCTHLWEHYTYTMDKEFLKNKAYPLMEGCALFLLDWLIEGHGGYLETNPSTSPQHMFVAPDGKQASVSYSSTMDIAIIKEVFSAFVSTAEAQDFQDPDMHHRHVSHLFGLFPGHTITRDKTPDLCKAADFTLYKRGLYERRVQDGQLHRKLYFEHVFTTVSTHTVWSNICLFWWIQIMRVILREDYTVTCTLHTLLSRLMPTMDFRQQLQKCLSRALLRICTYFQIFPGINGQMVVCKDLKHVAV